MADEWSQYAVAAKDEWSQYAQTSSQLTGNPTVDMVGANKDLATAQQGVQDTSTALGTFNKVTGWPFTNTKILVNNASNILSAIAHPADTGMALLKSVTHPVDALGAYIGRYSPDNIKTTLSIDPLGVVMDATVIGGLGPDLLKAGIKFIPQPSPEQLVGQAEKITQRILNPSKQEIADAILKKSTIPAVRETAKVIRKSPTEISLLDNIDTAIKTNFDERNAILESNNYRMTDNHIIELQNFINKQKAQGQVNPSEIRQMENVLSQEQAWYTKNKDNFDRVAGQTRKQELQDLTETLLVKREDGSKVVTQPARKQALDVLRSGLMKEVAGNDQRVWNLNSTYSGLRDAREMIANQAAIIQQNSNKGIVERMLLMAQSATNPQAAAINVALNNAKNISKLSNKAEKLMQRAVGNRVSKVIESAINNEQMLGLPDLTPQYLKDRQNIQVDLGVSGKPRVQGVPTTEPNIKATGYVPPKLPAPQAKYVQERQSAEIKSLGVKGIQDIIGGSKSPIYLSGAVRKTIEDLTNKGYTAKQIFDESYKAAIEAKKKRMINFGNQ